MDRPDGVVTARALVAQLFPDAVQAWLSGSVVLGAATRTSDLDVTVLLDHGDAFRESMVVDGWPVELFVHTEASIHHFVAKDVARRRPTMARLVATGVALLDGLGGAAVLDHCAATLEAGPPPLSQDELDLARYLLTDQLDDLAGGAAAGIWDAVVVEVWRRTAELYLDASGWWQGNGKWLVREVEACDRSRGTRVAEQLHAGLPAALDGDPSALVAAADEVLDLVGGRLWGGFRLDAPATT